MRLYRALLQSETQTLDDRRSEPYGVREPGGISLSGCHPNRVQAKQLACFVVVRLARLLASIGMQDFGDRTSGFEVHHPDPGHYHVAQFCLEVSNLRPQSLNYS